MVGSTTELCTADTRSGQCDNDAVGRVDGFAYCQLHHERELLRSLEIAGARINWVDDEPMVTVRGLRTSDPTKAAFALGIELETI